MGSSGSGHTGGISGSSTLRDKAREIIESTLADDKYCNVFIPHAWDYDDEYKRLVTLLEGAEDFKFSNYSVPREKPIDAHTRRQLELALESKIRQCSVLVVPAGMYVNHREWIQREIWIAKSMGKPIVAVQPWGSTKIPTFVQDNADEVVGWNRQSIVDAIHRVRGKK